MCTCITHLLRSPGKNIFNKMYMEKRKYFYNSIFTLGVVRIQKMVYFMHVFIINIA